MELLCATMECAPNDAGVQARRGGGGAAPGLVWAGRAEVVARGVAAGAGRVGRCAKVVVRCAGLVWTWWVGWAPRAQSHAGRDRALSLLPSPLFFASCFCVAGELCGADCGSRVCRRQAGGDELAL
eukprot:2733769-Prymnesium_polylepis.1